MCAVNIFKLAQWIQLKGASELVTGDEFTVAFFHFVTSYTTDVYSILYIICRCTVSVSCCCVLMAYTCKPILG